MCRLFLATVLLSVAGLLAPGCRSVPPPPPESDLPPLTAIRSERPPTPPRPIMDLPPAKWAVDVIRLDLPLDVPLNELWDIIDEQAVPDLARAVWQANGLRVGVLDPQRLSQLDALLPVVVARAGSTYYNAAIPTPVRTSSRLQQPVRLNLTVPPMAIEETRIEGGRIQLLMAQSDFRGGVALDLIPHHYTPRTSLLPRDPLERKLDGTVFEQLGTRVLVQPRQLVAVGLYWPWIDKADLPEPENLFKDPEQPEREQPRPQPTPPDEQGAGGTLDPIEAPSFRMPELQRNLGTALLTGRRGPQPVQILLLISLVPAQTQAPPGG